MKTVRSNESGQIKGIYALKDNSQPIFWPITIFMSIEQINQTLQKLFICKDIRSNTSGYYHLGKNIISKQ